MSQCPCLRPPLLWQLATGARSQQEPLQCKKKRLTVGQTVANPVLGLLNRLSQFLEAPLVKP